MYFQQFYLTCLAHASYMIGSDGVAAVVDPQRDVEIYLEEARARNLRIAYVIEKNCVSCKLCEQVCIKDAIEVPRQHQFEDIGMSFMHYVTDNH